MRHGEAYCNVDGVVGGHRGCRGLTERGRAQARALGRYLERSGLAGEMSALYTSELPRAVETASLLSLEARGLSPTRSHEWCEIEAGEADGLTWPEVVDRFGVVDWESDPTSPFSPGGESWLQFYDRVAGALGVLGERHRGERVLLVTHGGVIEHAVKFALGIDGTRRLGLRTKHCSWTEVEVDRLRRNLLSYNERVRADAAD